MEREWVGYCLLAVVVSLCYVLVPLRMLTNSFLSGYLCQYSDCYILKLFRDYVFHQADGSGRPVMDLGHVVSSLNKLDAADEEKIVLASRDGKNILVLSFADVAWCLEKAYQELLEQAVPPASDGMERY